MSNVRAWLDFAVLHSVAETYLDLIGVNNLSLEDVLTHGSNNPIMNPNGSGATKLTDKQIKWFTANYDIVTHYPDDNTGFSATVFRNKVTGEYTLSFRSTEYEFDSKGGDWSRDGKPGADGEISSYGFPLGQLSSMESFYSHLRRGEVWDNANKSWVAAPTQFAELSTTQINVTGYSLGANLATTFTLLHAEAINHTYTYNASGLGGFGNTASDVRAPSKASVNQLLTDFADMMSYDGVDDSRFTGKKWWNDLSATDGGVLPGGEVQTFRDEFRMAALQSKAESQEGLHANNIYLDPLYKFVSSWLGRYTVGAGTGESLANPTDGIGDNQLIAKIANYVDSGYDDNGFQANPDRFALDSALAENAWVQKVTQLYGHGEFFDPEFVANSGFHAPATSVFIEDLPMSRGAGFLQAFGDIFRNVTADYGETHSITLVIDSLTVLDLMQTIDPSFTSTAFRDVEKGITQTEIDLGNTLSVTQDVEWAVVLGVISNFSPIVGNSLSGVALALANTVLHDPDALEKTVDALGKLFLESSQYRPDTIPETLPVPMEGTANVATAYGNLDYRNMLHNKVAAIADAVAAVNSAGSAAKMSIINLVGMSAEDIAAKAMLTTEEGLGYRYALRELNPFALVADATFYEKFNSHGELNLYSADAPSVAAGVTQANIQDRAQLLALKLKYDYINQKYSKAIQSGQSDDIVYTDKTNDIRIAVDGSGTVERLVTFGSDIKAVDGSLSPILGDDQNDRLYGNTDNDTLVGGGGDDYLEGGLGDDEYNIADKDDVVDLQGNDKYQLVGATSATITDIDGLGRIFWDGRRLPPAKLMTPERFVDGRLLEGAVFLSSDGQFSYLIKGDDLFISNKIYPGATVTIRGFVKLKEDARLGLALDKSVAGPAPVNAATNNVDDILVSTVDPRASVLWLNAPVIDALDGGDYIRIDVAHAPATIINAGAGEDSVVYWELGSTANPIDLSQVEVHGGEGGDVFQPDRLPSIREDGSVPKGVGARFYGEQGDDLFDGSVLDEFYSGGDGHDEARDAGGNDILDGGAGNDWLDARDGGDIVIGGEGNDIVLGGADQDLLLGGAGNDQMYGDSAGGIYGKTGGVLGWDGNTEQVVWPVFNFAFPGQQPHVDLYDMYDVAVVRQADDKLYGGAGNDQIYGGGGNDLLYGEADDDHLFGEAGDDELYGGDGNDELWGDKNPEVVANNERTYLTFNEVDHEGALLSVVDAHHRLHRDGADVSGNDTLFGGAGSDRLFGGGGNDMLFGEDGNDYMSGGDGVDVLRGGDGVDNLSSNAGDDILDGGGGQNELFGGADNDTYIISSGANDVISDESGSNDRVYLEARSTDVVMFRGADDHLIIGDKTTGQGIVTILGYFAGHQIESIIFGDGVVMDEKRVSVEILRASEDADTIHGSNESDTMFLAGGDDIGYGAVGDDLIDGESGNDTLFGEAGNDRLIGGIGDDKIYGGTGEDIIDGGAGNDYLVGGGDLYYSVGNSGSDTYLFGRGDGNDTIVDFDLDPANIDRIIFRAGVLPEHVKVRRVNNDLLVEIENSTDALLISAFFPNHPDDVAPYQIERFEFVDSSVVWDVATVKALVQQGTPGDDGLYGYEGDDVLSGGAGNDTLFGDIGNDTLSGDDGNDVVDGYDGNDLLHGGNGDDLIFGRNGDDVGYGDAGNDTLYGGAGTNHLYGGAGNDTFNEQLLNDGQGIDTMEGGAGDDIYYVDSPSDVVIELAGEGTDTVYAANYTLPSNVENLFVAGGANGTGNELDNVITGNSGANTLTGGAGNDTLDGKAGNDTMVGGVGNDTYYVDSYSDVVVENAGEGTDTVYTSVSRDGLHPLGDNIENIILTGGAAINVQGNALNNTLVGNSNDNVLNGDLGADSMAGGAGDDTYYVDNAGDAVTENANEGADLVQSAVSFTLGANVENLTLGGTAAINGTGNALDNFLIGNSANNTLTGGAGNDRLDGGAGTDTMVGGLGDDTYVVERSTDVVTENTNEGIDTIESSVTLTLAASVENLTLVGSGAINGTGNALDNIITGNAANNTLTGGAGNDALGGGGGADTLVGGTGDDAYLVDSSAVVVTENANEGTDTVYSLITYTLGSNVENLTLIGTSAINGTGNALDNVLTGNSAANTLSGGAGNDTYVITDSLDTVVENASAGTDTVQSSISYTLGANVENLTLTGTSAINGTGNTLANMITGNSANNTLDGGAGADTLIGGAGNDTYAFGTGYGTDVITDNDATAGNVDRVTFLSGVTPASVVVGRNVDDLTLTLSGTSDQLRITNYFLSGGTSSYAVERLEFTDGTVWTYADVLARVPPNHAPTLANPLPDQNAGEGLAFSYTVAANAFTDQDAGDVLSYTALQSNGLALPSWLTFNASTRTFSGTPPVGSSGALTVRVTATDTGGLAVNDDFVLSVTVQNLTLNGTSGVDSLVGGAGNDQLFGLAGNDTLTGNAGNDTLDGGAGNDTMIGGTGNDTYVVDSTSDVVTENANEGTDLVQSSVTLTLAANVENLTLTGTTAINGTGNTLDNILTGNSAINTLTGGAGNDTLDGGIGADTMNGGVGNDTYIVDNVNDVISENVNEGEDFVLSSLTRTLGNNFEHLFLIGSNAINGTGNALANWLKGNDAVNTLMGNDGNDTLWGAGGNDALNGGNGVDILQGGLNDDTLTDTSGNGLLDGGAGIDTLVGGSGRELYIGGKGNDTITTGSGADIVAFNKGDGADTINASTGADNTLAIGGGVRYADMVLNKSGLDLILGMGAGDQITLKNWYQTGVNNKSIVNLQMVAEAMSDFNSLSNDALRNKKITQFNFLNIVSQFDTARAANATLTNWAVSNAIAGQLVASSDTAALGGDLAYQYGKNGTLANIGATPAQNVLAGASFATLAQTLQPIASLQTGTVRLS